MMRRLFSALLLLSALFCTAQSAYVFTTYSSDDGLRVKNTMDIIQDDKGILWLATWDGLYQFDGYTFHNYKSKPGDGILLASNRFDRLEKGFDGIIWIRGYDHRTYLFHPSHGRFLSLPIDDYKTNQIFPLHDGSALIKTDDTQLLLVEADSTFQHVSAVDLMKGRNIHTNMVMTDSHGTIWVMTQKGLFQYLPKKKNLRHIADGNIQNALEDGNTIYFNSERGTVRMLSGKTWRTLRLGCASTVGCAVKLSASQIAFGTTGDGIFIYDTLNGRLTNYRSSNTLGIKSDNIRSLKVDSHGDLWADIRQGGLSYMKAGSGIFKLMKLQDKYGNDIGLITKSMVMEDSQGRVWVSPGSTGLALFDRESGELQLVCEQKPPYWSMETNLASLCVDKQDNVWYCAKNIGLRKVTFQNNQFNTFKTSDNDYENNVRGILQDHNGYVWTGNKGATVRIFDRSLLYVGSLNRDGTVTRGKGDELGKVYSLCEDHSGNIWIGTKGDGLIKAERIGDQPLRFTLTFFRHHPDDRFSLSSDDVFNLHEDRHHRLWIATYGGGPNYIDLNNRESHQFVNVNNQLTLYPKDECSRVRFITSDKKGQIWICTTNGLLKTDGKATEKGMRFQRFLRNPKDINSLSYNDIHMVLVSKSGTLYVCTNGGGFQKMVSQKGNGIQLKTYTQTEGLGSDVVLSATEDTDGNIWLASEESISKFYPIGDKIETYSADQFPEHISIAEGPSTLLNDGMLCLPTYTNGMLYFEPDHIKASDYVPRIVFTRFMQEMREVTPGKGSILSAGIDDATLIRLPHDKNSFSIEFAALDYKYPDKVEYAYILEGFEKNWNYSGNQRTATYTNLPKGTYTLLVKSTNSDRVWVDNTRRLTIEVLPSFWETPWAYILYALALIGVIMLSSYLLTTFYRLRQKVTIEQQISDLKVKFFTNISHELRTPLTLIYGFMREILKEPDLSEKLRSQLSVVGDNAHRMLQLTNQILDIHKIESNKMKMKVSHIDLVPFVKDVMTNFDNIAHDHHIDYRLESSAPSILVWADSDKMDKILFNLISNAFKYTPIGKRIRILLAEDDGMASISVEDQGVGISKESQKHLFMEFNNYVSENLYNMPSSGLGLSLVHDLVTLHGGSIEVNSEPGKGSTFTVKIPTDREHFGDGVDFVMSDGIVTSGDHTDTPIMKFRKLIDNSQDFEKNTLLIVEDNEEMRYLLSSILIGSYNLIEAENGESGLKMALEHIPDIIISDIMMPVMNGQEMLRRLRADIATSHIPVIMLTAVSDDESKIGSMESGADSYIVKPFNSEILKAQVANLLEKRKRMQEYWQRQLQDPALSSSTNQETPVPPQTAPAPEQDFVETLNSIVNQEMANGDFVVDDLAQRMGMSRSVLFKKMKAITGMSPNEYIKTKRMQTAADLILQGNLSISEITYQVGINDPHYFSNCFKRQYGVSPTEYRRKKEC